MTRFSRIFSMAMLPCAVLGLTLTMVDQAAAQEPPRCNRDCLKVDVDNFLDALLTHHPELVPVTRDYKAIYNGKPTKLGDHDIWQVIDKIAYHQYAIDTDNEQIAFFGVAVENHKRGDFFLRLAPSHGKIALIEMTFGPRRLNGVPGLISPNPFFNLVLPKSQQMTRKGLIKVADNYFQALEDHDGSKIPETPDCRRFEDGVQTANNPYMLPTCNHFSQATYIAKVANRIYPVVDPARGLVLGEMVIKAPKAPHFAPPPAGAKQPYRPDPITGMVMWPDKYFSQPHDTIIHQLFKVIDGKVTAIQTFRLDLPYGWGGGWSGLRGVKDANQQ